MSEGWDGSDWSEYDSGATRDFAGGETNGPIYRAAPLTQEQEELQELIECSREMARTRNQTMNPRLPTPFEQAVETALGILIRQRQREVESVKP